MKETNKEFSEDVMGLLGTPPIQIPDASLNPHQDKSELEKAIEQNPEYRRLKEDSLTGLDGSPCNDTSKFAVETINSLAKLLSIVEKERDENHKAYQTVKDWAHRLEYKLISLMEKCEEAASEELAGSFPDNLVGMMNDLDIKNFDMAKALQQLSQLRETHKQDPIAFEARAKQLLEMQEMVERLQADYRLALEASDEISTHLDVLAKALRICRQYSDDDDDRSYWDHEIKAHESNSKLIKNSLSTPSAIAVRKGDKI